MRKALIATVIVFLLTCVAAYFRYLVISARKIVYVDGKSEVFQYSYPDGTLKFVLVFGNKVVAGTQVHLAAALTRRPVWVACKEITPETCDEAVLLSVSTPPEKIPALLEEKWRQATRP